MLFDFDFTCESKYIVYSFVYKLLSLAHLLAKFVSSIDYYLAWIEDSSCFLQQALLHVVSIISLIKLAAFL